MGLLLNYKLVFKKTADKFGLKVKGKAIPLQAWTGP
jgi:hypothetical protein